MTSSIRGEGVHRSVGNTRLTAIGEAEFLPAGRPDGHRPIPATEHAETYAHVDNTAAFLPGAVRPVLSLPPGLGRHEYRFARRYKQGLYAFARRYGKIRMPLGIAKSEERRVSVGEDIKDQYGRRHRDQPPRSVGNFTHMEAEHEVRKVEQLVRRLPTMRRVAGTPYIGDTLMLDLERSCGPDRSSG